MDTDSEHSFFGGEAGSFVSWRSGAFLLLAWPSVKLGFIETGILAEVEPGFSNSDGGIELSPEEFRSS